MNAIPAARTRAGRVRLRLAAPLLATTLSAPLLFGATVTFSGPDTTVLLGQPYVEFNNPLAGTELVDGREVLEWRDAGYACSGGGPPDYEDWTVSPPCGTCSCTPDGYANEIWLRSITQSASTTTTVPGTTVSVHLHGDSNDGPADIRVDGVLVASLNMFTAGTDNVIVIVENLASTVHTIEVDNAGLGDVAVMGAAVLGGPPCITVCTSVANATGLPATLSCSGSPSSSLVLTSSPVPETAGIFFYGPMMLGMTVGTLGDGVRCVGGGVTRMYPQIVAGMMMQLPNTSSLTVNYSMPYSVGLTGTKYFQHWFRSGLSTGAGSNSSDALEITF